MIEKNKKTYINTDPTIHETRLYQQPLNYFLSLVHFRALQRIETRHFPSRLADNAAEETSSPIHRLHMKES